MPLISIHIPKTGGTTFLELLSRRYESGLLLDYGLPKETSQELINSGRYKCVHGHFIADKYMSIPNAEYVFWLRNPIQRLYSQFYFWKKNKYPHSAAWRRFYFEEWTFADFALSSIARNEQSKYIGKLNIDSAKVVGITEFFEESIELFNAELGLQIETSSVPQHRKNQEKFGVFSYEQKDKKLEAAILEYHREDYEVYLKGLAHFRKKYDAISNKITSAFYSRSQLPASPAGAKFSLKDFIKDAGATKIAGTYYYGDGWPVNMWDTFRRDVADVYLDKIKNDGFNTVILLIPAMIPRLSVDEPELYATFLSDLHFIMKKLKERGLFCMYRLGFAWDGFPIKGDRGRACFSILAGGDARSLAISVYGDLWVVASTYSNFLYGFITWEDMLMFAWNRATKAAEPMKRILTKEIGYESESHLIPDVNSPEFKDYLDFIDVKFSELFYDLIKSFPRLSAEVRVDITPYTDLEGNQQHYVHNRQFVETDCDVIGTYFGTYMIHGKATADSAINGIELAHKSLMSVAPTKSIFIDQLLLIIKEKQFDSYPKLSDAELEKFIQWLPSWLNSHSVGYATWSFSDYLWDIVFNGTFRFGLKGWISEGEPKLISSNEIRYVELKSGDSLCGERIEHFSPWITNGVVTIEADISNDVVIEVLLSNNIRITMHHSDFKAAPNGKSMMSIMEFIGKSEFVKVSILDGHANIFRIGVGKEIISNGGYDLRLRASASSKMIASLNKNYLTVPV